MGYRRCCRRRAGGRGWEDRGQRPSSRGSPGCRSTSPRGVAACPGLAAAHGNAVHGEESDGEDADGGGGEGGHCPALLFDLKDGVGEEGERAGHHRYASVEEDEGRSEKEELVVGDGRAG